MDKKQARAEIRRRLCALSPQQKAEKSNAVCERVMRLPEFRRARVVMLFASMPDEVDTRPLLAKSFADGKRVASPKCVTQERRILPVRIEALSDLVPGAYGILEPSGNECISHDDIDLVLVPGYGFDRKGNRLGRGAGYYDKFMSQPGFRAVRCAVTFATQILDDLPHDDHDIPVEILVTEDEVLRFGP